MADYTVESGKIVSEAELAAKMKHLYKEELTRGQKLRLKLLNNPARKVSFVAAHARFVCSSDPEKYVRPERGQFFAETVGTKPNDYVTCYNEAAVKHHQRIGDKFSAAVSGKKLQQKLKAVQTRAFEQCEDKRPLRETGKLVILLGVGFK